MKILIAHDWTLIQAGIKYVLTNEFGPLEVTQASTALEGFDFASGPWDLAFVGVDASDHKGFHFITALKRAHPHQRVLVVSSQAKGFRFESVLDTFGSINVESTIYEVAAAGQHAITGTGERLLKEAVVRSETPPLSKQEVDVLRLLAAGKGIKQIVAALNVSPSSISTYRARMLRKLQLTSTGELIRYAFRNHLAD